MTGPRRKFRVIIHDSGRERLWGTYVTREQAEEIAQGLRDRGEAAQVRTSKRDEGKP